MGCVPRFLSFRRTNRSGCNDYEIIISPTVFLPDAPSDIRRGIIMHELLHTVRGCAGKTGRLVCRVPDNILSSSSSPLLLKSYVGITRLRKRSGQWPKHANIPSTIDKGTRR